MVVVALGNRLAGEWIHPTLRDRMDEAIRILRESDEEYLVCTGAQTNPDLTVAEWEVMRDYAILRGVDRSRLLLERAARDTIGNGYFTRRLLDDRGDRSAVRIVTSGVHTMRTRYVFERCFGEEREISVSHSGETDWTVGDLPPHERDRLDRTREFFATVSRGDVEAIGRKLLAEHDLYSWPDPDARSRTPSGGRPETDASTR